MFREMRELFEAEIAEHEENLDEADPRCLHHHLVIIELDDDDARDLIDWYLLEVERGLAPSLS